MWRALVLVAMSAAPDAGRVRYHIDPCSVLGREGDAGVGGMRCDEPIPGGWISRTRWDDGRREQTTDRRHADGGLESVTLRWTADGGVP